MKETSSSIHKLNADRGLNAPNKFFWIFLNMLNNSYFPRSINGNLYLKRFCPRINESDWDKIFNKSSPSRSLSNLFWLKVV
jgi:hypothetical protein